MSTAMKAQLVTDALVMAIWLRGSQMRYCNTPTAAADTPVPEADGRSPRRLLDEP
jgi:hypothetical protein